MSNAFVIRHRRPGETPRFVVEVRTVKATRFALRRRRPGVRIEWSTNLDDALKFATAALAACYIERAFGTAAGRDIVPLTEARGTR